MNNGKSHEPVNFYIDTTLASLRCELGCGITEHRYARALKKVDVWPGYYELIFVCKKCEAERVWGTVSLENAIPGVDDEG